MNKIDLKLLACVSILPMLAIPVLTIWSVCFNGLNFFSLLIVTVVMAVGTSKVYASCKVAGRQA